MTSLALLLYQNSKLPPPHDPGLWLFLTFGVVSLFAVLIPLASWFESQRKEREAFYRAETLRRITESSGEGAKAAIELMRREERAKAIIARESFKLGGLICLGLGVALMIFLWAVAPTHAVYLCGLFPGLVGVAMLVYVFFLAVPIELE